jgi:hypothetical protein
MSYQFPINSKDFKRKCCLSIKICKKHFTKFEYKIDLKFFFYQNWNCFFRGKNSLKYDQLKGNCDLICMEPFK